MSEFDETRERLASLLADVLAEGAADPVALVCYADDPNVLSPEDRQSVKRRLAESARYRDQLEVLRRLESLEAAAPAEEEDLPRG